MEDYLIDQLNQYIPETPGYFAQAVGNALYGTAAAAGTKSILDSVTGFQKKPKLKSSRKRKTTSTLKDDGVQPVGRRVRSSRKRRKRRKVSLKKRVSKLERSQPAKSAYIYKRERPVTMSYSGFNQKLVNEEILLDHNIIETHLATIDVPALDPTAVSATNLSEINSRIKLSNVYLGMEFKNNATANLNFTCKWVQCMEDGNESYLDDMREAMEDRGIVPSNSVVIGTAASATAAGLPRRITLSDTELLNPIHSYRSLKKRWKSLGPMETVTLGPGDTFKTFKTLKSYWYHPEDLDNDPVTYQKGQIHCIFTMCGDYQHNTSTNTNLVVRSAARIDGCTKTQFTIYQEDGQTTKKFFLTSGWDNTNANAPVHADNEVSALENDGV